MHRSNRVFSSRLVAFAAAMVVGASVTEAGLTPSINLATNPSDNGDGTFNWTYNITFTNATDVLGRPVDALDPGINGGTFITFFNVGDFISAEASGVWGNITTAPTGGNAFGTVPVTGDKPELTNVTVRYLGEFTTEPQTFTDFLTIRSASGVIAVESFTSQFARNSPPAAAGTPVGQSGFAVVAAPIPEPGVALAGLCAGAGLLLRRRSVRAS